MSHSTVNILQQYPGNKNSMLNHFLQNALLRDELGLVGQLFIEALWC